MRNVIPIFVILFVLTAGCRHEAGPDAYGNVEATEVVVGAEASGRIESFTPRDGDRLPAGAVVGKIETVPLDLQEREMASQTGAAISRLDEIAQQVQSLDLQRQIARRAYERTRRLYEKRAATASQLDQTERDYRVLGEQIDAAHAQQQSVRMEIAASQARGAQVRERLEKGTIRNPVAGTVLATYAETGEITQIGQPLYRIADLETVEVRAYVTETQLAAVRIAQPASVSVDTGADKRTTIQGTVTWVSPDAEFTPTPIQTRDERADLVYAVKIRLPNPGGILKIGMPADVGFSSRMASR